MRELTTGEKEAAMLAILERAHLDPEEIARVMQSYRDHRDKIAALRQSMGRELPQDQLP